MATALRFSGTALRQSLTPAISPVRSIVFNSLRCYSSSKTATLKETFAEKLPGEIEKIKKLRTLDLDLPSTLH